MNEKETKLQVEAIKCGTVIDHIPARMGFKLLALFKLTENDRRITIGLNLPSNALGKKDLIKIEDILLTKQQADQLAVYAPNATVNQIENYVVVNKLTVTFPERIDGILNCPNSNCISRSELISSGFTVRKSIDAIYLTCKYCEKEFERQIVIQQTL